MTELQKEVMKKVNLMSENDIKFLLVVIDKLMPDTKCVEVATTKKLAALQKLNESVDGIKKYFSADFNPETEYREALEAKYGNID